MKEKRLPPPNPTPHPSGSLAHVLEGVSIDAEVALDGLSVSRPDAVHDAQRDAQGEVAAEEAGEGVPEEGGTAAREKRVSGATSPPSFAITHQMFFL